MRPNSDSFAYTNIVIFKDILRLLGSCERVQGKRRHLNQRRTWRPPAELAVKLDEILFLPEPSLTIVCQTMEYIQRYSVVDSELGLEERGVLEGASMQRGWSEKLKEQQILV